MANVKIIELLCQQIHCRNKQIIATIEENNNVIVNAIAGSGKTITSLYMAQYFSDWSISDWISGTPDISNNTSSNIFTLFDKKKLNSMAIEMMVFFTSISSGRNLC